MNASGPVGLGRFLIGVLVRKADSNASSYPSLIKTFYKMLEKAGYKAQEGSIVDASIVEAPRQRARQQRIRQARQGRQERSEVCPARVAGGPPGQTPGGNAREPGSKRPVERLSYESIDIKMPE